jgi:hypothetical protein
VDLMEDENDEDLTYLTFVKLQKWRWCANFVQKLFLQGITLAISALLLPTRHKNS